MISLSYAADGTPTYMLAVVVDDHDMGVNACHPRRRSPEQHLPTEHDLRPQWAGKIPEYAHLPLILGPDGSKMSKRHGAASVEEYREIGYLPEAMRNYLLRLRLELTAMMNSSPTSPGARMVRSRAYRSSHPLALRLRQARKRQRALHEGSRAPDRLLDRAPDHSITSRHNIERRITSPLKRITSLRR
jgi:glutamyl/glutaminyl-tRNA synthetase